MRKVFIHILLIGVLLLTACNINPPVQPDTLPDLNYLFEADQLPTITLSVSETDWNLFLYNYDLNPDNRTSIPATFSFEKAGNKYSRTIGLRLHGNTSRRRPEGSIGDSHTQLNADWHHASFLLKFNEYQQDNEFFGTDRLILKFAASDKSYLREMYCYDLMRRMGVWCAPRASYCRLKIQVKQNTFSTGSTAYMGVMTMIEGVNNSFVKNRSDAFMFGDTEGYLWKATNRYGMADLSDFNTTGTSKMGIATDAEEYPYALKTHKSQLADASEQLYSFMEQMRQLENGSQELEEYLNKRMAVDLFLRAYAVNVVVGNWDDYWINANNYYCYFDSRQRFYFIPYDLDNSLGRQPNPETDVMTLSPLNWGKRDSTRMLIDKVLSVAQFEQQYLQYIQELITDNSLFGAEGSIARLKAWERLISPFLANDTGEDLTIKDKEPYLLLSGDDSSVKGSNFFRTRCLTLSNQLSHLLE